MGNFKTNKNVFVCCGGNKVQSEYTSDAYEIGKFLAENGFGYSQGGCVDRKTMMGESYYGYVENNGLDINVIVRDVFKADIKNFEISSDRVHIVSDIGELIKIQFLASDISLILPGGSGTLMEFMGYLEFSSDYEKSPVVILYNKTNSDCVGYYDELLLQLEKMIDSGFLKKSTFNKFIVVNKLEDIKKELLKL